MRTMIHAPEKFEMEDIFKLENADWVFWFGSMSQSIDIQPIEVTTQVHIYFASLSSKVLKKKKKKR